MSNWFYAANGQQQGPYPEPQFRDLISNGTVRGDTLVWSEGMAGWQKAGEVPGLMPAGGPPLMMPQGAPPPMMAGGQAGPGNAIGIDLPLWGFLGRMLIYIFGILLVIPAPWAGTSTYRWAVPRLQVPGRPNLSFTGQVGDVWWVFVLMGLIGYLGVYESTMQLISIPVQAFLSWMLIRWLVTNIASNGQKLPLVFNGSLIAFIGWQIFLYVSFITIIGWAWVATAWTRWICRNVSGTRREIVFNATGLGLLWRTIVVVILCGFIIPIPWAIRWYVRWYVSQFALVPRGA